MMWRRISLLVFVLVLTAVGAHAASSGGGSAPTAVSASSSLRLPSLHRCVVRSFVRVGLVPPPGDSFAALSVRVGSREVVQLASLSGPGMVSVALRARGTSHVRITATTTRGDFLAVSQTYRRCSAAGRAEPVATPKPKPKPHLPTVVGGGVD